MTVVGRNKLQQIRDASFEELVSLSRSVFQTAIDNIGTPTKWFDKSAYYQATEEITLSSMYQGIQVGGQNTIVLASLAQTSEYYLYSNFKTSTLSSRLWVEAGKMEALVTDTMNTHLKAKTTWRRVQKSLNNKATKIGDVPKWLTELEGTARYYGGDRKAVQEALKEAKRAIKKLRPDRELRKAYQSVIDAVEVKNFDIKRLNRATQRAFLEKAAYNNERIVRSELARAYNDAFWRRVADSPEITAVRIVLSSGHSKIDECDHVTESDPFGLGAGVYPADKAYTIPIHTNCLCMYEPIIRHIDDKRKARYSVKRASEGVEKFTPYMQRRIKKLGEPIKPHALPKDLVEHG